MRLAVLAILLGGTACGLLRREQGEAEVETLDLNRASVRRIEELPGITPSMARRIADGRPYSDEHDLVERGILTERELDRIADRISVEKPDR
jgi:DNA uptake protein ComE-like DNA-binding protein